MRAYQWGEPSKKKKELTGAEGNITQQELNSRSVFLVIVWQGEGGKRAVYILDNQKGGGPFCQTEYIMVFLLGVEKKSVRPWNRTRYNHDFSKAHFEEEPSKATKVHHKKRDVTNHTLLG